MIKSSVPDNRWRPTLGMITAAGIITIITVPLIGMVFFRLYENQLIRETEGELIAQSAVLAAAFVRVAEQYPHLSLAPPLRERSDEDEPTDTDELEDPPTTFRPVEPSLDLASARIRPRRPEGREPDIRPRPVAFAIGRNLRGFIDDTEQITRSDLLVLDNHGTIIAGGDEVGMSLAHIEEVRTALDGDFMSLLRVRPDARSAPAAFALSRGTRIRIFTSMPVYIEGQIAGVIYASRTPENIVQHVYRERGKIALAGALTIAVAFAIGATFVRTVTTPIRQLIARTKAIARGDRHAIGPLSHHGTRELASLTQSFMNMAEQLSERSDYIRTFTNHVSHELKAPLTSIAGAAEVLADNHGEMAEADRRRFLNNIAKDTRRMTLLIERLRDLAKADNLAIHGSTTVTDAIPALEDAFPSTTVTTTGEPNAPFSMAPDNAIIVFRHLIDNAVRHGAKSVELNTFKNGSNVHILVRDDGEGISPGNRERIFEAFFTTRRADGGTGMGLEIVKSILRAHGGSIRLADEQGLNGRGAAFAVTAPSPS